MLSCSLALLLCCSLDLLLSCSLSLSLCCAVALLLCCSVAHLPLCCLTLLLSFCLALPISCSLALVIPQGKTRERVCVCVSVCVCVCARVLCVCVCACGKCNRILSSLKRVHTTVATIPLALSIFIQLTACFIHRMPSKRNNCHHSHVQLLSTTCRCSSGRGCQLPRCGA